jgi:hypothetical protein
MLRDCGLTGTSIGKCCAKDRSAGQQEGERLEDALVHYKMEVTYTDGSVQQIRSNDQSRAVSHSTSEVWG